MAGFLRWIDVSSAERERMQQAIALFQESETRDELGLGTIRDGFADALFPGTSTIQTRLRYFLFVPWIYRELESTHSANSDNIARLAREREQALIEPLSRSDELGVFGARAGGKLKRLPSNIYWNGLRTWQILRFNGSPDQYHRSFDILRARRQNALKADDDGIPSDVLATWHERLPECPDNWIEQATFTLTLDEAEFIQGRILAACPGTMLAHLIVHGSPSEVDFPWLHPAAARLPASIHAVCDLARRFSLAMHGASLLYNLMLAELRPQTAARATEYRDWLAEWAKSNPDELARFDVDELWRFVDGRGVNVGHPTRVFVAEWMALLAGGVATTVADNDRARRLVADRERAIKGSRSRFRNQRALEQWNGASGTACLNYRWHAAQRLLNDLHAGLAGQ